MVLLITRSNRRLYEKELEQIFRLRHEALVEFLRWKGLGAKDGCEKDVCDNDEALYLATRDRSNDIVGCMRLNPTTGLTLTSTTFSRLVQFRDVPSSPTIFDITRYVVSSRMRGSCAAFHGIDLICAAFELGISEGWTEFTAVLSTALFSSILRQGNRVDALGFPESIEGQDHLAVSMPISEWALLRLYAGSGGYRARLKTVEFHDPEALSQMRAFA